MHVDLSGRRVGKWWAVVEDAVFGAMIVGAAMTRTGQRQWHPAGVGRKPVLGVKSLGEVNAPHTTTRRQLSNHMWIVIRTVRGRIVHTCRIS